MERRIEEDLLRWKTNPDRRPILLRGARQVGKTYIARRLGKHFENYVEINLEFDPNVHQFFQEALDPVVIVRKLSYYLQRQITPGNTLLFIDEIQVVPRAITALRYFYEIMPELHVIAAGSLLDFAIKEVGIPVGRIESRYIYPLSFLEFIQALDNKMLTQMIIEEPLNEISQPVHKKLLDLVGQYLAIGGMPQVVKKWRDTANPKECSLIHATIIDAYRQDFEKYAQKYQIKYLNVLLKHAAVGITKKFKYSEVEGNFRSQQLKGPLDLLETAGVIHRITRTLAQGIPLGAQADLSDFKIVLLDVGLTQYMLGLDLVPWLLDPHQEFINKGEIVEAFIGQELLAYLPAYRKNELFYWHNTTRSSQAEIDYLMQKGNSIIPIEVKSGRSTKMKSMGVYFDKHPHTPYGVKVLPGAYYTKEKVINYPLYAVYRMLN